MRISRWIGSGLFAGTLALFVSVGCSRNSDTKTEVQPPKVQVSPKKDNAGKPIEGQTVSLTKPPSFKDDVILEPAPEDEQRPPDKTCTGKSVPKLFERVANELWDKVVFNTKDGKAIKYRAVMTTELGDIHVDLFGDSAPNHVRNFICLSRAGYFDGMTFYFSLRAKVEDQIAAYIETGCPKGTGENGCGSIGYWLKPEINEKLSHEEGVLGACLNGDPNTASCRFYIAAAKMPQMDGYFTIFGKVSKGLDIVHTINKRAVIEENRPQSPVVIRSVTIHVE